MKLFLNDKKNQRKALLTDPTYPFKQVVDLSSNDYDQNTWYAVKLLAIDKINGLDPRVYTMQHLQVYSNLNVKPSWALHNQGFYASLNAIFYLSGWNWRDYNAFKDGFILDNSFDYVSDHKNPIGISNPVADNGVVLYLRGGGIYTINSNMDFSLDIHEFTMNGEKYINIHDVPAREPKLIDLLELFNDVQALKNKIGGVKPSYRLYYAISKEVA